MCGAGNVPACTRPTRSRIHSSNASADPASGNASRRQDRGLMPSMLKNALLAPRMRKLLPSTTTSAVGQPAKGSPEPLSTLRAGLGCGRLLFSSLSFTSSESTASGSCARPAAAAATFSVGGSQSEPPSDSGAVPAAVHTMLSLSSWMPMRWCVSPAYVVYGTWNNATFTRLPIASRIWVQNAPTYEGADWPFEFLPMLFKKRCSPAPSTMYSCSATPCRDLPDACISMFASFVAWSFMTKSLSKSTTASQIKLSNDVIARPLHLASPSLTSRHTLSCRSECTTNKNANLRPHMMSSAGTTKTSPSAG
mmetsp:Transcript_97709/g.273432  ORF Transcript_97709/g.273432 Transcript_97709/m.273432 type:complete len:308 (+) Transcript_97709:237-1160(+)